MPASLLSPDSPYNPASGWGSLSTTRDRWEPEPEEEEGGFLTSLAKGGNWVLDAGTALTGIRAALNPDTTYGQELGYWWNQDWDKATRETGGMSTGDRWRASIERDDPMGMRGGALFRSMPYAPKLPPAIANPIFDFVVEAIGDTVEDPVAIAAAVMTGGVSALARTGLKRATQKSIAKSLEKKAVQRFGKGLALKETTERAIGTGMMAYGGVDSLTAASAAVDQGDYESAISHGVRAMLLGGLGSHLAKSGLDDIRASRQDPSTDPTAAVTAALEGQTPGGVPRDASGLPYDGSPESLGLTSMDPSVGRRPEDFGWESLGGLTNMDPEQAPKLWGGEKEGDRCVIDPSQKDLFTSDPKWEDAGAIDYPDHPITPGERERVKEAVTGLVKESSQVLLRDWRRAQKGTEGAQFFQPSDAMPNPIEIQFRTREEHVAEGLAPYDYDMGAGFQAKTTPDGRNVVVVKLDHPAVMRVLTGDPGTNLRQMVAHEVAHFLPGQAVNKYQQPYSRQVPVKGQGTETPLAGGHMREGLSDEPFTDLTHMWNRDKLDAVLKGKDALKGVLEKVAKRGDYVGKADIEAGAYRADVSQLASGLGMRGTGETLWPGRAGPQRPVTADPSVAEGRVTVKRKKAKGKEEGLNDATVLNYIEENKKTRWANLSPEDLKTAIEDYVKMADASDSMDINAARVKRMALAEGGQKEGVLAAHETSVREASRAPGRILGDLSEPTKEVLEKGKKAAAAPEPEPAPKTPVTPEEVRTERDEKVIRSLENLKETKRERGGDWAETQIESIEDIADYVFEFGNDDLRALLPEGERDLTRQLENYRNAMSRRAAAKRIPRPLLSRYSAAMNKISKRGKQRSGGTNERYVKNVVAPSNKAIDVEAREVAKEPEWQGRPRVDIEDEAERRLQDRGELSKIYNENRKDIGRLSKQFDSQTKVFEALEKDPSGKELDVFAQALKDSGSVAYELQQAWASTGDNVKARIALERRNRALRTLEEFNKRRASATATLESRQQGAEVEAIKAAKEEEGVAGKKKSEVAPQEVDTSLDDLFTAEADIPLKKKKWKPQDPRTSQELDRRKKQRSGMPYTEVSPEGGFGQKKGLENRRKPASPPEPPVERVGKPEGYPGDPMPEKAPDVGYDLDLQERIEKKKDRGRAAAQAVEVSKLAAGRADAKGKGVRFRPISGTKDQTKIVTPGDRLTYQTMGYKARQALSKAHSEWKKRMKAVSREITTNLSDLAADAPDLKPGESGASPATPLGRAIHRYRTSKRTQRLESPIVLSHEASVLTAVKKTLQDGLDGVERAIEGDPKDKAAFVKREMKDIIERVKLVQETQGATRRVLNGTEYRAWKKKNPKSDLPNLLDAIYDEKFHNKPLDPDQDYHLTLSEQAAKEKAIRESLEEEYDLTTRARLDEASEVELNAQLSNAVNKVLRDLGNILYPVDKSGKRTNKRPVGLRAILPDFVQKEPGKLNRLTTGQIGEIIDAIDERVASIGEKKKGWRAAKGGLGRGRVFPAGSTAKPGTVPHMVIDLRGLPDYYGPEREFTVPYGGDAFVSDQTALVDLHRQLKESPELVLEGEPVWIEGADGEVSLSPESWEKIREELNDVIPNLQNVLTHERYEVGPQGQQRWVRVSKTATKAVSSQISPKEAVFSADAGPGGETITPRRPPTALDQETPTKKAFRKNKQAVEGKNPGKAATDVLTEVMASQDPRVENISMREIFDAIEGDTSRISPALQDIMDQMAKKTAASASFVEGRALGSATGKILEGVRPWGGLDYQLFKSSKGVWSIDKKGIKKLEGQLKSTAEEYHRLMNLSDDLRNRGKGRAAVETRKRAREVKQELGHLETIYDDALKMQEDIETFSQPLKRLKPGTFKVRSKGQPTSSTARLEPVKVTESGKPRLPPEGARKKDPLVGTTVGRRGPYKVGEGPVYLRGKSAVEGLPAPEKKASGAGLVKREPSPGRVGGEIKGVVAPDKKMMELRRIQEKLKVSDKRVTGSFDKLFKKSLKEKHKKAISADRGLQVERKRIDAEFTPEREKAAAREIAKKNRKAMQEGAKETETDQLGEVALGEGLDNISDVEDFFDPDLLGEADIPTKKGRRRSGISEEELAGLKEKHPEMAEAIDALSKIDPREEAVIGGVPKEVADVAKDIILGGGQLARTGLSAGDLSLAFRQTLILNAIDPLGAPKRIKEMARMWGPNAEKAFNTTMDDVKSSPHYALGKAIGLDVPLKPSDTTEFAGSDTLANIAEGKNLPGKVAPLRLAAKGAQVVTSRSEYSYIGGQARAIQSAFDSLVDEGIARGEIGPSVPVERQIAFLKDIAAFVNTAGARAQLKTGKKALSHIFFSPRLIKSRVEALADMATLAIPLPGMTRFKNKTARKLIRRRYAKAIGNVGNATLLAYSTLKLMGHDPEFETDARSSDFLKIKVGDMRIDTLGGFQQFIRFGAQMWTGERKETTTGQIREINRLQLALRFARTKAAPIPGFAWDKLKGRTFSGDEVSWNSIWKDNIAPLAWQDLREVAKQDMGLFIALAAPILLGVGVQTWTTGENYRDSSEKVDKNARVVFKELRDHGLRGPRPGRSYREKGRDELGRPNRYRLSHKEYKLFEKEVMPTVLSKLRKVVESPEYQNLDKEGKRKRLYRIIRRLNRSYSVAKRGKQKWRSPDSLSKPRWTDPTESIIGGDR